MKTLLELLNRIDEFYSYLEKHGQEFTQEGWPIIGRECFQTQIPDIIIPYNKRTDRRVKKYSSVAICLFCADKYIYPRLDKLLDEIDEYRKYMAVISCDLTVTSDMDEEWQKFIILANELFMAILAINGVKVIINTRIGNPQDFSSLKHFPKNVICASGFLGCKKDNEYDMEYISKILYLQPSVLLIYGKCSNIEKEKLSKLGIRYKVYNDYHRWSEKEGKYNG